MTTHVGAFEEIQDNSNANRRRTSKITYRQRPFTDLVDEDKHSFVKRRYLSTFLGGYRIVADETSDNYIGLGLHIA